MTKHSTIWRVPPWAYIPLGAAIIAEAVSNSLRAYGLGMHLDRFTVTINGVSVSLAGSVLVLAAVAISLSQARAAWIALTPNPMRQRIVAGLAAALLLAVSVTAMASHILEAQRAKVADEGGARGAYDRAEAAYKRAAAELEALGTPRPVSVIQTDVRAFKIDAGLWRRSKECEEATKPDTQDYCDPILALYKERGAAARKTELEPEVARLRDELASLPRPEVATTQEAVIGGYWAWIMGLAVVFVATFGSVIFARVENGPDQSTDRPAVDVNGQSDYPLFANHPALLKNVPDNVKGFDRPAGGTKVKDKPKRPSPRPSNALTGPPDRPTDDRKGNVLAFIQTERAFGRSVPSRQSLSDRFDIPKQTISDWCRSWAAAGLIPEGTKSGRYTMITSADKKKATA